MAYDVALGKTTEKDWSCGTLDEDVVGGSFTRDFGIGVVSSLIASLLFIKLWPRAGSP